MTSIVVRGHLAWLAWMWAVLLALLPVALAIISAADGELSESLWSDAGAGWQSWVLFAAGIITAGSFLRLFVTHGVTRRRFFHRRFCLPWAIALIAPALVPVALAEVLVARYLADGLTATAKSSG